MTTRAGVTQSVFHEVFFTVDDCYRAAYKKGIGRLSRAVAEATKREPGWLARVRTGLVALLGFFDDERAWARLLVLETPVNAAIAHECRQQLDDVLIRLLDRHREADSPADSPTSLPALAGELTVGGVFSVIRTSMLEHEGTKLVELAPSVMAFIAIQYGRPDLADSFAQTEARAETVSRVARLPIRVTHRTTLVLRAIAQTPYSNNREIARAAGIVDEGQTSKLLGRLEGKGVIENVGVGAARGEPNAWLLTAEGHRAVDLLGDGSPQHTHRRPSRGLRGAT